MNQLFRNNFSTENTLDVYDNYQDAHASSIQSAAWAIQNLILEEGKSYTHDPEVLMATSEEISEACKQMQAAIDGKFVVTYNKKK